MKKRQLHWLFFSLVVLAIDLRGCSAQFAGFDDERTEYKGKRLGSFNSYSHQVNGEVYAVDEYTLRLQKFTYNGQGTDAFFWAGGSPRPGTQGFIVPDENGRTNVLRRYLDTDITISLPDGKKITDLKWFSVYDLTTFKVYADLTIPEEFEPPKEMPLTDFEGKSNNIGASMVIIMNSKMLKLEDFSYDGQGGDVYFWVGTGPQPSSKGTKVPDDMGYLTPLRRYDSADVYLSLPGDLTLFDIRWFSVFDLANNRDLGHIIIQSDKLNVPPALMDILPHKTKLPNCEMLHSNLYLSWSIFAPYITLQLTALAQENEYAAFGVSKQGASDMVGADVAVMYVKDFLGYVDDYNITARTPCTGVVGINKGVCRDDVVGGVANNQLQEKHWEDGILDIVYRRELVPSADPGDKAIKEHGETSIVWAIGRLARNGRSLEPSFHHTYPKGHITVDFGREPQNNCLPFSRKRKDMGREKKREGPSMGRHIVKKRREVWKLARLADPSTRTFEARLGPSGGAKGYTGITGLPTTGTVWYVNGQMAPEIYLRRGLTYAFRIEGGNDPYSPEFYHPFVITNEPVGGFERLSDRQKTEVRLLAGVEFTRRGVARATAAGRLCLWKHPGGGDRRLDDNFDSFVRYRNSLHLECDSEGKAAVLEVTPNFTWPDVVYYNSFTMPYMGWKINVVDSFNNRHRHSSSSSNSSRNSYQCYILALTFALTMALSSV